MMTIRQIERLWNDKSHKKLSQELLAARPESSFAVPGLDRPAAVAALAIIRLDELSQSHVPLYGTLVRAVLGSRDRDGGWGDPATTALCVRALMLGRGDGAAIDDGLAYLASLQKEDGLWPDGPLRRMPQDPVTSLFILYQLSDSPRFRAAVRFAEAVAWFTRNVNLLNPECQNLCKWASLRWRAPSSRTRALTLFAA